MIFILEVQVAFSIPFAPKLILDSGINIFQKLFLLILCNNKVFISA